MRVYLPQFRISLSSPVLYTAMVVRTTDTANNRAQNQQNFRGADTFLNLKEHTTHQFLSACLAILCGCPVLFVDRLRHGEDADDFSLCLPSVDIPLAIHC